MTHVIAATRGINEQAFKKKKEKRHTRSCYSFFTAHQTANTMSSYRETLFLFLYPNLFLQIWHWNTHWRLFLFSSCWAHVLLLYLFSTSKHKSWGIFIYSTACLYKGDNRLLWVRCKMVCRWYVYTKTNNKQETSSSTDKENPKIMTFYVTNSMICSI